MSNAAAGVSHWLGEAADYSFDVDDVALETPDGIPVGKVLDTLPADTDTAFIVQLEDGRMVKVTCEEVQR